MTEEVNERLAIKNLYVSQKLVHFALALVRIKKKRVYEGWGFGSFAKYIKIDFGVNPAIYTLLSVGTKIESYSLSEEEINEIEHRQKNYFSLLVLANFSHSRKNFHHNATTLAGDPRVISKALRTGTSGNWKYGPLPFLASLGRNHDDREIILAVSSAIQKKYKTITGKSALAPFLLWYVMHLYPRAERVSRLQALCRKHGLTKKIADDILGIINEGESLEEDS